MPFYHLTCFPFQNDGMCMVDICCCTYLLMAPSVFQLLGILSILSIFSMVLFMLRCSDGLTADDPHTMQYIKRLNEIQILKQKMFDLENHLKRIKVLSEESGLKVRDDTKDMPEDYDVPQYASFSKKYVYGFAGASNNIVVQMAGIKRQEIKQVVLFAITHLYSSTSNTTSKFKFMDGIVRTDPGIGNRYELYFKNISPESWGHYRKITVFKPFGILHHIASTDVNCKKDLIHMIVPLSGRLEAFKLFMQRFVTLVIKPKEAVFLSVVYFGIENADEIKQTIDDVQKTHDFTNITYMQVSELFSRGRAIQSAVDGWTHGDVLMFFCDIDIIFTNTFLQHCRMNTQKGSKIFYPLPFSLYNPDVVYTLQDIHKPRPEHQIKITTETGFWRDFGYGMTCQYHSDFLRMNGFKQDIVGWGTGDILLYRKYLKSNITVIRAVDHGLFHLWNKKECDRKMHWTQFKSCIRSRARNEASHELLGLLAFQDEINAYKKRHGMFIRKPNRTVGYV